MNREQFFGYAFLVATVVLFSSMETAGRSIHSSVPPLTMTFTRFFVGFLFIFLFIAFTKKERETLRRISFNEHSRIFLLGFLNIFLSMMFIQIAVHNGNASVPAVVLSSNPLFVYMIVSAKSKSVSNKHLIKILAGITGIAGVMLFSRENSLDNPAIAFTFSTASSFLFALYAVLAPESVKKHSNLTVTGLSFLYGSLLYIPFIFAFERGVFLSNITFKEAAVLSYMSVFITGLGYILFFEGLKRVEVHIGSLVFFLKPILALLYSFIFLREVPTAIQVGFVILVLYSIIPSFKKKNADNS